MRTDRKRRTLLLGGGVLLLAWRHAAASDPELALATGSREPLISAPGRPGFVEELAREACRRIGHRLRIVPLPVERALTNANAGIEDGDLFRSPGFEKDYPNLMQVPQPLMDQDFVGLTLRPDIQARNGAELTRWSVAIVTGNKILERALEGHPALTTVRDNELLLRLLAAGRVDVVVINRWVGLEVARRLAVPVRVLEPPLKRVAMFMYLHRKHQRLVQPLADALAEMRSDGTWQRLHDQLLKPLETAR